MSYAVDTNILARSIQEGHSMQLSVLYAIKTLLDDGETVCALAQNLYEFWVIATRPVNVNGLGMSAADTQIRLREFETRLTLKTDLPEIYAEWKKLVTQHAVMGKPAHDARIVAAMKVHDISHLLTFNTGDFRRFSEITAISPTELQKQS